MGTRVLVLDDEPLMARMASQTLRMAGYDAVPSEGWSHVATEVRAQGTRVLVVDWEMPGIDGGTVVRSLRNAGLLAGVGVVIFSGADRGMLARAVADGVADAWVPKDSPASLVTAVQGLVA